MVYDGLSAKEVKSAIANWTEMEDNEYVISEEISDALTEIEDSTTAKAAKARLVGKTAAPAGRDETRQTRMRTRTRKLK